MRDMVQSITPLVSVIIPTYNRAHLISQSIESVLNQTFKDYEIIVVNDGSTDNTKELLSTRYGEKILYIGKKKNKGLSAARNTGIEASRGKYIAILDDDDEWLPHKLEMQIDLMHKNQSLGLVYCGYYEVNRYSEVIREIKATRRGYVFSNLLCGNCIVPASAALVKREVFFKTGYFDENLSSCEDWDMWLRVSQSYEVDFVDQPLVKYKIHDYNMHKNLLIMEKSTFSVLNKYLPGISEKKSSEERKNKAYSKNCTNLAWNYYQVGDEDSFKRLLYQALEYYPLNEIFIHGDDLAEKENALFEVFHNFWNKPEHQKDVDVRKKTFTTQFIQLAWEYYHHGDMRSFRRCIRKAFKFSFPRVPLRLSIPFIKSFLGKNLADRVHNARERLVKWNEDDS